MTARHQARCGDRRHRGGTGMPGHLRAAGGWSALRAASRRSRGVARRAGGRIDLRHTREAPPPEPEDVATCPTPASHHRPACTKDLGQGLSTERIAVVFAALAVTHEIEHNTGWSIKKFVQPARRYRTIAIR